jgi:hypothetical protein
VSNFRGFRKDLQRLPVVGDRLIEIAGFGGDGGGVDEWSHIDRSGIAGRTRRRGRRGGRQSRRRRGEKNGESGRMNHEGSRFVARGERGAVPARSLTRLSMMSIAMAAAMNHWNRGMSWRMVADSSSSAGISAMRVS